MIVILLSRFVKYFFRFLSHFYEIFFVVNMGQHKNNSHSAVALPVPWRIIISAPLFVLLQFGNNIIIIVIILQRLEAQEIK